MSRRQQFTKNAENGFTTGSIPVVNGDLEVALHTLKRTAGPMLRALKLRSEYQGPGARRRSKSLRARRALRRKRLRADMREAAYVARGGK